MDKILRRYKSVMNERIDQNLHKLIIILIAFFGSIFVIRFNTDISRYIWRHIKIDIETFLLPASFILIALSIISFFKLIIKFIKESSFKWDITGVIRDKEKIAKIEEALGKNNSQVIATDDYLIVFNKKIINTEQIKSISLESYTKMGFMYIPSEMLALCVRFKGSVSPIVVDICKNRHINFEKRLKIIEELEKLKNAEIFIKL